VIDLHCHLLPGIDDGPPDMQESVALATAAARAGIHTIAATPHFRPDHPGVRPEELADRCAEVSAALNAATIDVAVVTAAEVDVTTALWASDEELRLASYHQAGAYLLVETPYTGLPEAFEDWLFTIATRGFRILLAHPERNATFQRHPSRLENLVRRGTLVQVTAASLLGERRSRTRAFAERLVERGLVHVLASDSHRGAGWREPDLSLGVAAAAAIDPVRAEWMVTDAPAAILAGEDVVAPIGVSRPSNSRLSLRRRLRGG
jgi:protein-tyrosine phosphatase